MPKNERAFCPGCGTDVEVVWVETGRLGNYEEPRCPDCGFTFEQEAEIIESHALPPPLPGRASPPLFGRVAVVDDAESVRRAVCEDLVRERLARTADPFADGTSFLSGLGAAWASGAPYELAVLDLQMAVLDGLKTAAALRNLEKSGGRKPMPIVFLSGVACDQRLREKLGAVGPGSYLNKGQIKTRADLPLRLGAIMRRLHR